MALALDQPAGLTVTYAPTGHPAIPTLSWDRVTGATKYDVEVSTSSLFNVTPVIALNGTSNVNYVPTVALPAGTLHWRVRANGAANPWSTGQFDQALPSAPGLVRPAVGTPVRPPADPAILEWTSVTGALDYQLQYSSDSEFDPSRTTTRVPDRLDPVRRAGSLPANTYYWHVRARIGATVYSPWSDEGTEPWSFVDRGLPLPERVAPDGDNPVLQDATLRWLARARSAVLPAPGQHRPGVQAADVRRERLRDRQHLLHAAQDAGQHHLLLAGPPGRSRRGPRLAGRTVDVHPDLARPARARVPRRRLHRGRPAVVPVGTGRARQLLPAPGGHLRRVRVGDGRPLVHHDPHHDHADRSVRLLRRRSAPATTGGGWSAIDNYGNGSPVTEVIYATRSPFTYDKTVVVPLAPAAGRTTSVPTLSWNAVATADRYRVTLTDTATSAVTTAETAGTSWTPPTALTEGGTYRWRVQTLTAGGTAGPATDAAHVHGRRARPGHGDRGRPRPARRRTTRTFPTVTWERSATRRRTGCTTGPSAPLPSPTCRAPSPTPRARTSPRSLPPGDYEWYAEALRATAACCRAGDPAPFTIEADGVVTGYRAGILGTTLMGAQRQVAPDAHRRPEHLAGRRHGRRHRPRATRSRTATPPCRKPATSCGRPRSSSGRPCPARRPTGSTWPTTAT